MAREIIAIRTERPVLHDRQDFKVGDVMDNNKVIERITRSIGGLSDVSSAGPAVLGPNCPTFIITMVIDKDADYLAVPERIVDSVLFKAVKKGSKKEEPDIEMTKE
jgi:hypothetical protein